MLSRKYREKHVKGKRWNARRNKTRILSDREGDCVVYCLTNRINGKMYVGYSAKSVFDRWGKGGKGYKGNCPAIWAAIEKYTWNNFEKHILVDSLDETTAKEIEKFTIAFLKRRGHKLYNLTDGGDSSPMKNPEVAAKVGKAAKARFVKHPESHPMKCIKARQKVSEAKKEYWKNNPEAREAMSAAKKELYAKHPEKNPMYGKTGADNPTSKAVVAINPKTGLPSLYFESALSAEKLGFNHSCISACCNRIPGFKTHKCYIWRFVEKEE